MACEQDALWFAYLQRRGLITPDGFLVEQPPSVADPIEPLPSAQDANSAQDVNDVDKGEGATESSDKGKFACDDPMAG